MLKESAMNREEILKEYMRLTTAIRKSESPQLRRDYSKRLRRLRKSLRYSEELRKTTEEVVYQ